MARARQSDSPRILWLAQEDVSAAARLLSLLSDGPAASAQARCRRRRTLDRARLSLALRRRRIELLGRTFAAEPPFAMLLSLYVGEGSESTPTVTSLADLAWLTPSTTLRWIEPLIADGWITRRSVAEDRRKSEIALTEKARKAMDELFGWPE